MEPEHEPRPAGLRLVHDAAPAVEVSLRRLLVACLLVTGLLVTGCGRDEGASSGGATVAWADKPLVVRQPELPDDTIVSGRLRNESGRELSLDASDVRLLDEDGKAVRSTARFALAVSHSLYPPGDGPSENPRPLRERLGEVATVAPGKSVPLVVSWRVGSGEKPPVRVDLGEASLTLP
jgi:hypothetical protein